MKKQLKQGFTLIEIVIVLAIAALIMVIVFFAVQGANRGQRNDARRSLVGRVASSVQTYRGNNNGNFVFNPNGFGSQIDNYIPAAERRVGATTYGVASPLPGGAAQGTACTFNGANANTIFISADGRQVGVCTESGGANGIWYIAND